MSGLKRTELRHKLLAEVAAGDIAEFDGSWVRGGRYERISATESLTLGELENSYLIYVDTACGGNMVELWLPVYAQKSGSALLSEWNTKYGKVDA